MRLFLAIDLPEKIKTKIEKQIFDLKKQYPQFNWVNKENFHITLHFFGEVDDFKKIKEKIEKIIWDQKFFYLYSFNLDVFANHRLVLYLDFYREKEIEKLAETIKKSFAFNPYNQNKFIPHLTLARGPRSSKQQYYALKNKLNKIKINISFKIEKIFLYQSILKEKKPIYKKLAVFGLLDK
ncbi:MAG: RNA 2',3'-cyclic phosphodiesterase [Patescibacteria group bacterium]|nr:RNA 2',3'-cyclic phosphodiesterase [Patescibacteria group bacterium]